MLVGLIDIDYNGSFPNIPLMKWSAWHKAQGDGVEWYNPFTHYDIVYMAKVFSWTADYEYPINADKVVRGGSGYNIHLDGGKEVWRENESCLLRLPDEVEHIYPDYSLYPSLTKNTAYGFLTRGCPRGCSFCHVAAKEGRRSVQVAELREFWIKQKNIVLCDPNILACKDWKPLLQSLIDSKAWVDFNQGLDARLMTEEKASMLGEIKMREVHFAWDRYDEGEKVLQGLRNYQEFARNKPSMRNCIVYTITNFDTTIEQDLDRIYRLRDAGFWAYVCIYDIQHADPVYKQLQRWCNNRFIFGSCPRFEDYNKPPAECCEMQRRQLEFKFS